MERFLIFGGSTHYPSGGWKDYLGNARSTLEALELIASTSGDWFHIYDLDAKTIVKEITRTYR